MVWDSGAPSAEATTLPNMPCPDTAPGVTQPDRDRHESSGLRTSALGPQGRASRQGDRRRTYAQKPVRFPPPGAGRPIDRQASSKNRVGSLPGATYCAWCRHVPTAGKEVTPGISVVAVPYCAPVQRLDVVMRGNRTPV